MKAIVAVAAAALLAVSATSAIAKSGKMKGAYPGKSYSAPGHVKKRLGLQSARTVAPGHRTQYLRVR